MKLVKNLQNAVLYDHPVTRFDVIETHISYVILTGDYVYKIKKPLDMGFLDFSTLDKRLFYCQEETRLNKKMAPDTYLGVVKITGTIDAPIIGGDDHAIEYAVKMREFPQTAIFDSLLKEKQLTTPMVNETAQILAEFHQQSAKGLADNPYGTYQQIHEPVIQNFDQIKPLIENEADLCQLSTLSEWADAEHIRLQPVINARKAEGYIRECHGDVHLGNIALIDKHPMIFDCIEFNDSFRWTDVMADLAFLAMDLEDKQQSQMANSVINSYFARTGDYGGLHILNYYKAYRAVVRAKIALFQRMQASNKKAQLALWQQYKSCANLAERYCRPSAPALVITHGLTASGKTTIAEKLVALGSFVHISSDRERKRLAGLPETSQSQYGVFDGIYSADATETVYEHLLGTAQTILQAGYSVVVDATFIKQCHRQSFQQLAQAQNIPFHIIHTYADEAQLMAWLNERQKQSDQVSEAREDIYRALKAQVETLTKDEIEQTLSINMSESNNLEQKLLNLLNELAA